LVGNVSLCRMMATGRKFLQVKAAATAAPGHQLKVVTYNILANKYAVGGYHNYCEDRHLKWPYRREAIKLELEGYDPDLLCLQEVEDRVFRDELQPWMKQLGLQGLYQPRQFGEVSGPPEGVALFWRSDMFRLIESRVVQFAEHAEGRPASPRSTGSIRSGRAEFWDVFCRREEGAVLALLEHTPSGCPLLAVSTHLFWNPAYPDVKSMQAAVLCKQISALLHSRFSTLDVPVIIGGDFNSLWRKYKADNFDRYIPPGGQGLLSGVYSLMSGGQLPPQHPDHPAGRQRAREQQQQQLVAGALPVGSSSSSAELEGLLLDNGGLSLVTMHMSAHGCEPPLTTKTASFAGTLDYVWLSKEHFKVLQTLSLPYTPPPSWTDPMTDVDFPPIPNEHYPSDHLAMGCVLELLPVQQQQQGVASSERQVVAKGGVR